MSSGASCCPTSGFVIDQGARHGGGGARPTDGRVVSPMPGVVVAAHVVVGEKVASGQPLVSVEAMKMEHVVVAPTAGMVTEVRVQPGQAVALEEVLVDVVSDGKGRDGLAEPGHPASGLSSAETSWSSPMGSTHTALAASVTPATRSGRN